MNAADLNKKFGINGRFSVINGKGDIPVAVLEGPCSSAKVCLLGAHIMSWRPNGKEDTLWMSEKSLFTVGKAIRGGIPVCWPWFSKHPTDETLPMHGFARIMLWTLENAAVEGDDTIATFSLTDSAETRKMTDASFKLTLTIRAGKTLTVSLTTENRGNAPLAITQALHTYFNVGDISKVSIDGFEGEKLLDKLQGGAAGIRQGNFIIDRGVDEIYPFAAKEAIIHDGAFKRDIHIAKEGSSSAVVWNPWIEKSISMADFPDDGYKTMLCVETTNVADDKRTIPAGSSHTIVLKLSI